MSRVISSLAFSAALAIPGSAHAAAWHPVQLPYLWPNSGLNAVAATGPDGVWVVGHQGQLILSPPINTITPGSPVVRRWNGTRWLEYPLTGWSSSGTLGAVTADPRGEVWVSTPEDSHQNNYLARFTGTAFEAVQPPPGNEAVIKDSGPAGAWVWTGWGDGELFRRTGSTWTRTPLPSNFSMLGDVAAYSATSVWAVGFSGWDHYAIARWDGSAWHDVPAPASSGNNPGTTSRIVPVGPEEFWLANAYEVSHYKAGTWTITDPAATTWISDLAVDSTGRVWLAAQAAANEGSVGLFTFDGTTAQPVATPAGHSANAITAVPGSPAVWTAGSSAQGKAGVLTNG
ncbi:MAG: hypothetical protein ABIS86_23810 [Streptosporangiaceae bacterium]